MPKSAIERFEEWVDEDVQMGVNPFSLKKIARDLFKAEPRTQLEDLRERVEKLRDDIERTSEGAVESRTLASVLSIINSMQHDE